MPDFCLVCCCACRCFTALSRLTSSQSQAPPPSPAQRCTFHRRAAPAAATRSSPLCALPCWRPAPLVAHASPHHVGLPPHAAVQLDQRQQSEWAREHLGPDRKVFLNLDDVPNHEVDWRQVRCSDGGRCKRGRGGGSHQLQRPPPICNLSERVAGTCIARSALLALQILKERGVQKPAKREEQQPANGAGADALLLRVRRRHRDGCPSPCWTWAPV